MQPRALLVIALLAAPHTAAAFGNLDCITVESCTDTGCTPQTIPFSITFEWANETAIVATNDAAHVLPFASSGDSETTLGSVIEYGDPATANRLLRIEASGTDITAYYTFQDDMTATWVATCNVRQAA